MKRPRVVVYADSPVFGGCDHLVSHLLTDETLARRYELSLVYRRGARLEEGLRRRVPAATRMTAVEFADRQERLDRIARRPAALRYPAKAWLRLRDAGMFAGLVRRLEAAFAAEKPDLVHINNGGYPGALGARAAALAAKRAGARRVLMSVHNLASFPRWPWRRWELSLDARVAEACDAFATASAAARERLLQARFPRARVERVLNGVEDRAATRRPEDVRAELGLAPAEVVVVVTAFFEPRKGHAVLVEAARRLASRDLPAHRFVLIGDGPERPAVETLIARAGLTDRFRLLGYRHDAAEILAAADALALPSTGSEDMPLAVLDAMALAKPVVASSLAGIPEEVEDGRTGLLVPPGEPEALAAALQTIISSPARRAELGRAGRARFLELFQASAWTARYGALYDSLLGAATTAPQRSTHV